MTTLLFRNIHLGVNRLLLVCMMLFFLSSAFAVTSSTHYWVNYTIYKDLAENWQLNGRVEMRYTDIDNSIYRAGVSPELRFSPSKVFSYSLGSRFFYYNSLTNDGEMEYRPWLGMLVKQGLNEKFSLAYTGKWEHRLLPDRDTYESRLRFGFSFGYLALKTDDKQLKISFAPELFCSLGNFDTFETTAIRWVLPISYKHNSRWTYEFLPTIESDYSDLFSSDHDYYSMIRFNIKNYF